ncbi:MAG TPA: ATP synthase F1 subunit gamma [Candidatus Limnocylindria bacterium]|nr:ATP synthase F1 subunit gamma [Candidatus Limnocylindria bacterium]
MPSLKALRKRIGTVRSTQQITKAMKMVAAAKLRRAQDTVERARPYAQKLAEMFAAAAAGADASAHPLLARRDERLVDMLLITSDRGLCGGYNANILRLAETVLRQPGREVTTFVVGRKALEYLRRRSIPVYRERIGVLQQPAVEVATALADELSARFVAAESDAVYLVYSQFRSAISQVPTVVPLLPVALPEGDRAPAVEYIFEPPQRALLGELLPAYLRTLILQALLEAAASEHGARMTAMENATTNASEMIDRLTLSMNRARQATITTELMEIVSGAEALKG